MSVAIDLISRYHNTTYMRGGPQAWTVNRQQVPIDNFFIHHIAGWYGPRLTASATQAQERAQIDSLARDHYNRFGIGPGYNYCVFPSGRLYAVGAVGTSRRHTSNINPATGRQWNWNSVAFVFFGNFDVEWPTEAAIQAVNKEINWLRTLSIVNGATALTRRHGAVFNTSCPGARVGARLADIARRVAAPSPPPSKPTPPPPAPTPPEDDMELSKLEERIARLEQVTYGYGFPVTVTDSNKALVESLTNTTHSVGGTLTLRNERALEYARRRGVVLATTLDNLNSAVHKLAREAQLSDEQARSVLIDTLTDMLEGARPADDAGHADA